MAVVTETDRGTCNGNQGRPETETNDFTWKPDGCNLNQRHAVTETNGPTRKLGRAVTETTL